MDFKEYFKSMKKVKLTDEENLSIKTSGLFTEARLSLGLTQAKLARKMKTKQPGITRWESGESIPSLKVLLLLAKIQKKRLIVSIK